MNKMGGGNSPQGGGLHLQGMYLTVAVNIGLVLAQVAFGAYHVIGKEALSYISPVVFAFYRECIAGPTLVIIALIVERAKPDLKADWWRFVLLGATGVYMNQLFFILGLQWTSSDEAAIMQPCIPVFTTALTLILRMEKFSVLKIIGILFSAAGAVVMVGVENLSFKSEQFKGMMCLLGNTLAMSVYYILQKPVLKKYPPISVTGWAYIVGSVLMGVTSLIVTRGRGHEYVIERPVIFPLAYSILAATVFTYMTLTWANKHAPASVVAAYSSLQPLTAAILSYIVWRVVPTRDMYIGGAAIIVGLAIVTFARSREAKAEAAGAYHPINPSFNNPSISSSLYPSPNNNHDHYNNDYNNNNNNSNHDYIVPVSHHSSKWGVNNNDNTDFQRKSFNNQSEISSTPPVNR